ncbi:hypothetical protein A2U01_0113569, partial [Trifolium medium]|nr:hypothetical protein [Trifolium medium]
MGNGMWRNTSSNRHVKKCTKRTRSTDGSRFKDTENSGNGNP